MKDLKVVFFGTPNFVIPVLEAIKDNFNLVGAVTAPDKPIGRKQILTPSPVKQATSQDIPMITPEKLDSLVVQQLKQLQPDLLVVAAYGKIIPQNILDIPKFGALNIHPSCLPKYRGPSPIQTTILNGDKNSCITIIKMDAKMDHGPIVSTREIMLSEKDNFETLSKKVFDESAKLLTEIIPEYIEGKIKIQEQNHEKATFTKIITKEDGYFDINNPLSSEKLERMIRAYYPWPTTWTKWNDKIVKFLPAYSHPELARPEQGRRVSGSKLVDSGLRQNDKFLVQMEGKKPVKLEDFLRGYPEFPIQKQVE